MAGRLRIILHIGTEKTGTTTLQHALQVNRDLLSAQGVHYLTTPGRTESRAFPSACLNDTANDDYLRSEGIDTPEQRQAFRQQFGEVLSQAIAALPDPIHTVVISSEHFHSRLRDAEAVARVREWLAPYTDEFRVVCYLRRQVDVATSFYSTELKSGGTHALGDTVRRVCRPDNHYYNYEKLLSLWGEVFSPEALIVRQADRKSLRGGSVVDDFLALLGIDVGSLENYRPVRTCNESLNHLGQMLLRQLNRQIKAASDDPNDQSRLRLVNMRLQLAHAFAGKGEQLPPAQAADIQHQFDASNEAVRKTWFPEQEALFSTEFEDNDHRLLNPTQETLLESLLMLIASDGQAALDMRQYDCYANTLRDSARLLEEAELPKAYELMTLASIIRPNGPFIRKKANEYKCRLESHSDAS
ncbi:hypothetical protein [Salinicola peritrichatus]|uniref:hypothetical protein n=1 Tax=Salinicola peritrichatus TaxID=1267424 RepID=UPI000DA1A10F|nr:hypothetical protein [Salinicola peritrichatus]